MRAQEIFRVLESEDVDSKKLAQAADSQRGKPEAAMLQAQKLLGGGVLSFVIEHVGDLYNRMHNTGYGPLGDPSSDDERREVVLDKVSKTLRILTNPYGFEREYQENMRENAKYRDLDLEDFQKKVDAVLLQYAQAHSELPVYNRVQNLAVQASVALGQQKFDDAVSSLISLRELARDPKAWAQEVNKVGAGVAESASGYIPSDSEKDDPRFSSALTVDVKPNSIQKNARAFGSKIARNGRPPLLR